MMNPFKGMNKEEILAEAQRYKHLFECAQKIDKSKNKKIRELEAQLAARNQAAEAMGALERLVKQPESIVELEKQEEDKFHVIIIDMEEREVKSISEGSSLIEAVLMAGGDHA